MSSFAVLHLTCFVVEVTDSGRASGNVNWRATMESLQPAIVCRNVTKRFRNLIAVADFSLEVSSGICAVLGPNGAGKSTLLKILTGLLGPDAGEVRVCGLPPEGSRPMMGVMPEDLGLFDLLTIKEHLELTGSVYGLSKDEA